MATNDELSEAVTTPRGCPGHHDWHGEGRPHHPDGDASMTCANALHAEVPEFWRAHSEPLGDFGLEVPGIRPFAQMPRSAPPGTAGLGGKSSLGLGDLPSAAFERASCVRSEGALELLRAQSEANREKELHKKAVMRLSEGLLTGKELQKELDAIDEITFRWVKAERKASRLQRRMRGSAPRPVRP
mmetsp:Transcript_58658/g.143787  ORF Transcript_58658/g.143787 Transcript_58658/m.143787 type:complete len:186 (-) Transcript_58658:172-729(-)